MCAEPSLTFRLVHGRVNALISIFNFSKNRWIIVNQWMLKIYEFRMTYPFEYVRGRWWLVFAIREINVFLSWLVSLFFYSNKWVNRKSEKKAMMKFSTMYRKFRLNKKIYKIVIEEYIKKNWMKLYRLKQK